MDRSSRRTPVLLLVAVLVVAAAAAGLWYARDVRGGSDGIAAATNTAHVVTEPAPGEPVGTDEPVVPTGGAVMVTVTWSGWDDGAEVLEVDGFVTGVVESAGTCRLTATRSGRTVTAEQEAVPDVSTTQCGALTIGVDELGEGSWSAVLSYESPTSAGTAEPVTVRVPGR